MDLLALAFEAVFGGGVVVAAALLLLTYVGFVRMNRDVRRARMFLMADRVRRFLGAFTFGLLLFAAASLLVIAGVPTAESVFAVVIVLFLASLVYGSLELFLVVRPRRPRLPSPAKPAPARADEGPADPSRDERSLGGDGHAAR